MSRTIEVASIHIGTINLGTKDGEQRSIDFEDKGGVGFALVDEAEAEILLGGIGRPEYWKPGTTGDAVADALNNDPEASPAAAALMAGKKAVAEAIEKIKAAQTVEEVDALLGDDKRKNVVKAAEDRKAELQA